MRGEGSRNYPSFEGPPLTEVVLAVMMGEKLLVIGMNAVAGDGGIVPLRAEEEILHGVPLVNTPCDGELEETVFEPEETVFILEETTVFEPEETVFGLDDGSGDVEMSEGQEDVCVILTSCLEVKLPAKNLKASVLLEKDLKKDPVNPSMLAISSRILV